jgi:hypothetical protein
VNAEMPAPAPDRPVLSPLAAADLCALYEQVDAEVARLGPVCQLSGRCCRFKEYGHTLFVSTLEAQHLMQNAPAPERPLDDGETCPSAYDLSERFIAQLKTVTDKHGLTWNYAPLHRHLEEDRDSFLTLP